MSVLALTSGAFGVVTTPMTRALDWPIAKGGA